MGNQTNIWFEISCILSKAMETGQFFHQFSYGVVNSNLMFESHADASATILTSWSWCDTGPNLRYRWDRRGVCVCKSDGALGGDPLF